MTTTTTATNTLFPIFVKLEQFRVLIVGGGFVGMEKISALLNNSPLTTLTLVGREISDEIKIFAADFPHVSLIEKPFEPSDLDGKDFVIVATDDKALNLKIKDWAQERRILCNVADTPHACDFYLASIVQKGHLKIAISSNGKSPTITKRLKEVFQDTIPDEIDDILEKMTTIRQKMSGDFSEKVKALNALTEVLVQPESDNRSLSATAWKRIATLSLAAFGLLLLGNVLAYYISWHDVIHFTQSIDTYFWLFIVVGFVAQLVDGLLGMGYGVTTAICLMAMNINLAAISSSIHTAEMFSSGASGYSHYKFGNINKKLFKALLIPGIIGAVGGALALSYFGESYGKYVRPFLAIYTLLLGFRILSRAFVEIKKKAKIKNAGWLALAGGFLDSFGGGGWGPLVTSTLISKGKTPQYVIGSVSLSEFFITFSSAITFFSLLGISHWPIILGLIVGGVTAAPLAARLAGKLPTKWMFVGVGCMVIFWSLRILWKVLA